MKTAKRIWVFLISFILLFLFCLQSLSAEITYLDAHRVFDYSSNESQLVYFRASLGDSYDLKGNSYAVIAKNTDTDALKGIESSTCAVNESFDSIHDQLYTTAAYVSLTITLESGETLLVEEVVRCIGDFCVTADVSASAMEGLGQNSIIEDFSSSHMIYNRLSKFPIEFEHDKARIERIIFEPLEKTLIERRP